MDRLTADDIRALAQAGESQTLELKLENESQNDIGVLLASLANADGGTVLFGVSDAGVVMGVTRLTSLLGRIRAAARICRPPLTLDLIAYDVAVGEHTVVVAQVPALLGQLYSYNGVYRRRQDAENVLLLAEEMRHLILDRLAHNFDAQPLDLLLEALDRTLVERLLNLRLDLMRLRGEVDLPTLDAYPAPSTLDQLVAMGALAQEGANYRPTVAGLLMLSRYPERTMPQAIVRVAAFADDGAVTFLDRAEIGGPLSEQLDRVVAFINRNTRLGATIGATLRTEQPQYPPAAVREAVVNALIHRSYSSPHPTLVHLFPTRLEILSPGGLLPGIKGQPLEGKHMVRNHNLSTLAYFARLAEAWGTGIRRMRAALQAQGLAPPSFSDEDAWLRLSFSSSATAIIPAAAATTPELPRAHRLRGGGGKARGLNGRQRDLLAQWERTGSGRIGRPEYQERYRVGITTAVTDLQGLVEAGFARQEGGGPTTMYVYLPPTAPIVADLPAAD